MSYIKLDRKMLEWEWMSVPVVAHLWIYLLLKANHKKTTWQEIEIGEGELLTSISVLGQATGLSTKQVRTALDKLKRTNEITCKTTNKYTLIRINKWSKYQGEGKQRANKEANERANERATIKEVKEVKNINNPPIIPPGESECSPEFAEALDAFAEMRKRIKKPLTDRAKQMVLKKLQGMAADEETQIAILNQSTMNSWQGIFPLTTETNKKGMVNILDL